MAAEEVRFSIVIPTYNRPLSLRKCLESLSGQLRDRNEYEIIVVNDAGDNSALADITPWRKNTAIRLFALEHKGPAGARNFGLSKASGSIILFLDDDCIPLSNWFDATVSAWNKFPDSDGIGGSLWRDPNDCLYSRLFTDFVNWYQDAHPFNGKDSFFSSCNCGYKKSILEKVGGFNEAFKFPGGEDRDLNIRIARNSGRLRLDKRITAYHAERVDFIKLLGIHFRYGRAAYEIYKKYPDVPRLPLQSYNTMYASILKKYTAIGEKATVFLLLTVYQISTVMGYVLEMTARRFLRRRSVHASN